MSFMLSLNFAEWHELAHYTHCHYAECRGAILNVIMPRVVASSIYLSFYVIHLIISDLYQI